MRTPLFTDELDDIPGTTVFNAQRAGGHHPHKFCMSLMQPDNREFSRRRARLSRPLPDGDAEAAAVLGATSPSDRPRRQHLLPRQAFQHRRLDHPEGGQLDDQHDPDE
jgi:hypothetical protein